MLSPVAPCSTSTLDSWAECWDVAVSRLPRSSSRSGMDLRSHATQLSSVLLDDVGEWKRFLVGLRPEWRGILSAVPVGWGATTPTTGWPGPSSGLTPGGVTAMLYVVVPARGENPSMLWLTHPFHGLSTPVDCVLVYTGVATGVPPGVVADRGLAARRRLLMDDLISLLTSETAIASLLISKKLGDAASPSMSRPRQAGSVPLGL